MMVDNEFEFDFQKYLELEFSDLNERLIANRHPNLESVYEIQGRIRQLRAIGTRFKEMAKTRS